MSAEAGLQFVDTNILVYAYDSSAKRRHELARALLAELWQSGQGCLSIQTLQEFFVTITRKVAQPMPADQVAQIISDLGHWKVHTPTVEDVLTAIALQQRYRLSFWDAMILTSAERLECGVVWSEDLNPGQSYTTVKVLNPFVRNTALPE
jgi:predicted nucleic acid-binding protein